MENEFEQPDASQDISEPPAKSKGATDFDPNQWVKKSAYAGLQGYANQLKRQLEETQQQLSELSQTVEQYKITEKDWTTRFDGQKAQIEQLNGAISRMKRDAEVGSLIQAEFPGLASLQTKGLLNVDGLEGDALRAKLAEYSEAVGLTAQQQQQQLLQQRADQLAGAVPPAPGQRQPAGVTAEQLQAELMSRTDFGSPEYEAKMRQYMSMVQAEKSNYPGFDISAFEL